MHPPKTLRGIYEEHRCSVLVMVETLLDLDVPSEDALLLSKLPWKFPANRIAVERERLGVSAVHPLLGCEWSPPPPTWLTPAVMVQLFQLALDVADELPTRCGTRAEGAGGTLALPA